MIPRGHWARETLAGTGYVLVHPWHCVQLGEAVDTVQVPAALANSCRNMRTLHTRGCT